MSLHVDGRGSSKYLAMRSTWAKDTGISSGSINSLTSPRACSHYRVTCMLRHVHHRGAVSADRGMFPDAAGQRQNRQPGRAERHSVRGRERLQVAQRAEAIREVAHDLHADESVGESRCVGPRFHRSAGRRDHPDQGRVTRSRQHDRPSASRWNGGGKKTDRNPSDAPAGGGAPRFIWLPRMLGER